MLKGNITVIKETIKVWGEMGLKEFVIECLVSEIIALYCNKSVYAL